LRGAAEQFAHRESVRTPARNPAESDAELGCRIQESFKVAHSTSGKVMQRHDRAGLCTALRKRANDPPVRFLPVARNCVR
jgi:hypothetical protein